MDAIQLIALSMGAAWASGLNLYATIFMLGLLGSTGHIQLPPDLLVVTDPLVMFAAVLMYCIEFFADKVPGVDTAWDTLHTFIRIPAGAVLAMGAMGDVSPAAELAAFLLGGTITAGVHITKAGSRILINTTPEPFSNWVASLAEDIIVIAGLWAALQHPVVFLALLAVFILLMIWLLPRLWQAIRKLFTYLRNLLKERKQALPASVPVSGSDPDNPQRYE